MGLFTFRTDRIDIYDSHLNTLYVDGFASPGRVRFSGVGRPYKWKKNPGTAMSKASLVGSGPDLCEFTVYFDLWETSHMKEWELFKELLEPPILNSPPLDRARNFSHPTLIDAGIKDVVTKFRGALVYDGVKFWTSEVQCIEWGKPEPVVIKPRGGVPAAKAGGVSAQTEADRAVEETRRQLLLAQKAASL